MNRIHEMKQRRRSAAGFTLVELMVVIAIIAALATIVGVNVLGALDEGDVANAKAQIRNFKTALTSYRIAFSKFPSSGEGLNALVNNPKKNFLDSNSVPKDPWGNDYVYKLENNRPIIISYGADGAPGGSGLDADISSEDLGAGAK